MANSVIPKETDTRIILGDDNTAVRFATTQISNKYMTMRFYLSDTDYYEIILSSGALQFRTVSNGTPTLIWTK